MNSYDANDDDGFEANYLINVPFADEEVLNVTLSLKNNKL